ncbi:hypothetical protein [Pantoea sp. ME81]|uniref:hypothetical protein n=1 Tax=Pantoea sp. ME81 TaxID=2743935 RepID=UPI0015F6893B|nr:hypothetical protein [Pantoea sp. ME81]
MNLTIEDAEAITALIRADRPHYTGPVFVDLGKLEELHMRSARTHVQMAILFASGRISKHGHGRAA